VRYARSNMLSAQRSTYLLLMCAFTSGAGAQSQTTSALPSERVIFRSPENSGVESVAISSDAELIAVLSITVGTDSSNRVSDHVSIDVREVKTGNARFSSNLGEVSRPNCTSIRHTGVPSQIGFSPNGRFVAAGAVGCSEVKCWDLASGKECLSFLTLPFQRQWFRSLRFSDDSHRLNFDVCSEVPDLGAGPWEEELLFFDTKLWAAPERVSVPADGPSRTPEAICTTHMRADRSRFYSVNHENRELAIWDVRADRPRLIERRSLPAADRKAGTDPAGECAFSGDGSLIFFLGAIVRSEERGLTAVTLAELDGAPFDVVEFSPDGSLLAGIRFRSVREGGDAAPAQPASTTRKSGAKTFGDMVLWNAKTGERVAAWTRPERWPKCVAIFPKNDRILISDGTEVAVWQVVTR
jgi:WD40 repeat protein